MNLIKNVLKWSNFRIIKKQFLFKFGPNENLYAFYLKSIVVYMFKK